MNGFFYILSMNNSCCYIVPITVESDTFEIVKSNFDKEVTWAEFGELRDIFSSTYE